MSRIQPGWERSPFFESDGQGALNRARILFAAEGKIFKRGCASKKQRPVHFLDGPFDVVRALASCIQASNQSAHAVSGEIVDRNMMLLKPPEHADVGQPQRTAAFKRNADLHSPGRSRRTALRNRSEGGQNYESQYRESNPG